MDGDEAHATAEAQAEIRFALSQLGARNAMYEFEHLARALARMTVSRNLLPATGPVSGGGDQGRDAESYVTELAGQVLPLGRELGIGDDDGVAIACTLQQDDVMGKLRSDVKKIVDDGTDVSWVVAYCEANVSVAARHAFQKQMRDDHGVHVEVFDGNGITELLAQRHLYWIARQFLSLPERVLPSPVERPNWYEDSLAEWQSRTDLPSTMADLVDIQTALRFATENEDALADLSYWLDLAESIYANNDLPENARMAAGYDIARANLRGLSDLRPAEAKLAAFVEYAMRSDVPSVVLDAAVLVAYGAGARIRGLTGLTDELDAWGQALLSHANYLLDGARTPGRRCELLNCKVLLLLRPDVGSIDDFDAFAEVSPDHPHWSAEEWDRALREGRAVRLDVPMVDRDGALDALVELAKELPQAPLFPVSSISGVVSMSTSVLGDDPRFEIVTAALDSRMSESEGGAAAANAARDRAMQFFADDRLLLALRELHKARSGWFSGDYSRGLVLTNLMIAECYHRLYLPAAAKYHALLAVYLMRDADGDLLPGALFSTARADYHQGAWLSAVTAYSLAVAAHDDLVEDPSNVDRHHALQEAIFAMTNIGVVARKLDDEIEPYVFEAMRRQGFGDLVAALESDGDGSLWWQTTDLEGTLAHVASELGVRAFADHGSRRRIRWTALGATWDLDLSNDYENTIVGERLAAMLQVGLADLARRDPAILPTNVTITLTSSDPTVGSIVGYPVATGSGSRIDLTLPQMNAASADAFEAVADDALQALVVALAGLTVRDAASFMAVITEAMEDDLKSKLLFGTSYDTAFRNYLDADTFAAAPRTAAVAILNVPAGTPPTGDGLAMPTTFGPGFTAEQNARLIQTRYERIHDMLPATLPALSKEPAFQQTVAELRNDGWLDWHILLAVFNIAQNVRFPITGPPASEEEARRLAEAFPTPESPTDTPVPVRYFRSEHLRKMQAAGCASILQNVANMPRQNPPHMEAVRALLIGRYGYNDDVDHDDPFAAPRAPE